MLLGFEHIGMTSGDLDRAIAFYCDLLGFKLVLRKPQTQGELAFLDAGGGMLEIFAPGPGIQPARDVPQGEAGARHLTFAFTDIGTVIEQLATAGVDIIERPRRAHNQEMFKRVAFVRDPDGIIIELAERAEGR
ncbi:VOC family protein [uncultured Devosia sp.]|uniref:VOC family protein n=1 Tax=uncultured Devosia sp. TaxID=211434 RepID=UPI0035CB9C9F